MSLLKLFPTPVYYQRNTGFEFTEEELDTIKSISIFQAGEKNLSQDTCIFDNFPLERIRDFCQKHLDIYTKEHCRVKEDFYIHRSWLTTKNPKQEHQIHNHPNSILSGVFYINANPEAGMLEFYNEDNFNFLNRRFNMIYEFEEFNEINSSVWSLEVTSGTMIIFPSWMRHGVTVNQSDDDRICIAFNCFVKDYLNTHNGWVNSSGNSLV